MNTLRLILGDQLNYKHSWYREKNQKIIYFMAEMRQETDYAAHHIQKVVAFFEAMQNFAEWLKSRNKEILYYQLQDRENQQDLSKNIKQLIKKYDINKFEYQLPDEYRLDKQLEIICKEIHIESETYDSEHFLTKRTELGDFFDGKKTLLMENFYHHMRRKHNILIKNTGEPEGGKWNYDQSNRKKWKGEITIPKQCQIRKDVKKTLRRINKSGIKTIGSIDPINFPWPSNRIESQKMLRHFCKYLLPYFGDYQDAMDPNEVYLFHSRLSFSLNTKMLSPSEVIEAAISHWRSNKKSIHISQVEGFVRQVLGWREYMRGIYWREMPDYSKENKLNNSSPLPAFYWDANTDMNCLHQTISNSLQNAYAHHIQRLMITGNFALLTQTDPNQVEAWYLGVYIDAIEWVEMPNTRGMSQYADGGLLATKPYVSSGSYINKMSNYCKDCRYKVKERVGDDACPFNSLYWYFLLKKKKYLNGNPRMAMMLSTLDKMTSQEKNDIQKQAIRFLRKLYS
ncbi:(6-4) photolyase [Microbulbifer sp. NBRC 101763]|uniref:cryptochrome/photolyase family protein n=1 Tax=Microbulbifer sp. NBRC 101763 TaxID=1113820 RepID=UPI0030B11B16